MIAPHPSPISPSDLADQRSLVLVGYSWAHYLSLDELFHGTGVRVRYLDHHLEITAPLSQAHEERKIHVSRLVEAWCLDRDIELFARGSTTLKIPEEAGGEPDESYCIGSSKELPDLVIEIALTSGGLSKRAFYAKFKIPELWIWRHEKLEVHVFNEAEATYTPTVASVVLPGIDLQAIQSCATLPSLNQAVRRFREIIGS